MYDFRSHFNYLLYLFFLLFFIGMASLFLLSMYLLLPPLFKSFSKENIEMVLASVIIFGYMAAQMGYQTFKLRFGLLTLNGSIFLRDQLFFVRKDITNDIIGYSNSHIGWRDSIPCTVIYLKNKKHINFARYMYWDFDSIETVLQQEKIPYLGEEPYISKYIISRRYKFDTK